MHVKKSFLILFVLSALCSPITASLHSQLIEPTRRLNDEGEGTATVTILSEPPGIEVQLDGQGLGKTPIFSARFPAGVRVLRIDDTETHIHLEAGKTTAISWFKGSFIEIPEKVEPSTEIVEEPLKPGSKPKPDGKPEVQRSTKTDPYYWPLNPRGPIQ